MCGDGSNDVVALNAADVGVALLTGFNLDNSDNSNNKISINDKNSIKPINNADMNTHDTKNNAYSDDSGESSDASSILKRNSQRTRNGKSPDTKLSAYEMLLEIELLTVRNKRKKKWFPWTRAFLEVFAAERTKLLINRAAMDPDTGIAAGDAVATAEEGALRAADAEVSGADVAADSTVLASTAGDDANTPAATATATAATTAAAAAAATAAATAAAAAAATDSDPQAFGDRKESVQTGGRSSGGNIKIGDASAAAPFTARRPSIRSVVEILR